MKGGTLARAAVGTAAATGAAAGAVCASSETATDGAGPFGASRARPAAASRLTAEERRLSVARSRAVTLDSAVASDSAGAACCAWRRSDACGAGADARAAASGWAVGWSTLKTCGCWPIAAGAGRGAGIGREAAAEGAGVVAVPPLSACVSSCARATGSVRAVAGT
ncbi:hypothetical protein WJX75_006345 [Coccomyxa subellipsoidea]|uniref:Uncharacterized protein n=1 Tax=Coccomyxa subellipsoidea TaxID=248742 RepID=A0ABR2YCI9_9CHLO